MEREAFQAWLAEADRLSSRQREEATRVLAEPASLAAVLALLEARVDKARRCPHCLIEGAVIRVFQGLSCNSFRPSRLW